jgi:hypothetical protein
MPFLWKAIVKLLTNMKSPSPKHKESTVSENPIEKASLPASLRRKLPAGMTVEAAIVLPLFLFFFINLGSAMEMIRLHGNLQLALWNVGNKMCVYGYAIESSDKIENEVSTGDNQEWWQELGDIALSYTYIKSQVVNYVDETYLEESPLSDGVSSLQFWESELLGAADSPVRGDTIEIVLTYQVSPWLDIPFVRPFRMSNRYYGHLWTGYDIDNDSTANQDTEDVVYIAENGSVYHETPDCTHLKLSISAVTLEEAQNARNENGGRYQLCSKCGGKPFNGTVYIGKEGDFYHYDRNCSGLKRTIHTILRKQASNYRPCSRCAAAP